MRKRILILLSALIVAISSFSAGLAEAVNTKTNTGNNNTGISTSQSQSTKSKKKSVKRRRRRRRKVVRKIPKNYYVSGAMRLPYTNKVEFKKSTVRKPLRASEDGEVTVRFTQARFAEKDAKGKVYVRLFFRDRYNQKWVTSVNVVKFVQLTDKPQDFDLYFNVPKGRPLFIKLYKNVHEDVKVKGRITVTDENE